LLDDAIQLRQWEKLPYHDPVVFLRELRKLELQVVQSDLPPDIKSLRRGRFKRHREGRNAALFCLGMSQALGTSVSFARQEAADYDFVARWRRGDDGFFAPVQLKELVPRALNPAATLDQTLASLARYSALGRTVVAILINRPGSDDLSQVRVPAVGCGGIWLYWAASPDQQKWQLYGNLLDGPCLYEYQYPD